MAISEFPEIVGTVAPVLSYRKLAGDLRRKAGTRLPAGGNVSTTIQRTKTARPVCFILLPMGKLSLPAIGYCTRDGE